MRPNRQKIFFNVKKDAHEQHLMGGEELPIRCQALKAMLTRFYIIPCHIVDKKLRGGPFNMLQGLERMGPSPLEGSAKMET